MSKPKPNLNSLVVLLCVLVHSIKLYKRILYDCDTFLYTYTAALTPIDWPSMWVVEYLYLCINPCEQRALSTGLHNRCKLNPTCNQCYILYF